MTQAAAQARAERLNFHIIATFSARRARIGVGMGERAPAGAARAPMELVQITETLPPKTAGGKPFEVDVTKPGFHTARRRLPLVLSRMDKRDARRVAAERYAQVTANCGFTLSRPITCAPVRFLPIKSLLITTFTPA